MRENKPWENCAISFSKQFMWMPIHTQHSSSQAHIWHGKWPSASQKKESFCWKNVSPCKQIHISWHYATLLRYGHECAANFLYSMVNRKMSLVLEIPINYTFKTFHCQFLPFAKTILIPWPYMKRACEVHNAAINTFSWKASDSELIAQQFIYCIAVSYFIVIIILMALHAMVGAFSH